MIPLNCRDKTRTCLTKPCSEDYGFPHDVKTTACTDISGSFDVIFCPSGGHIDSDVGGGSAPPPPPAAPKPPASNGNGIAWNDGDPVWALGCDFNGNDLGNARVPAAQCGPTCSRNGACTHFTWSNYNGGTCWMKKGSVNKGSAFRSNSDLVCGIRKSYANAVQAESVSPNAGEAAPTTTTTATISSSPSGGGIAGWSVGLLVIGSIGLLLLVVLIALQISRGGSKV